MKLKIFSKNHFNFEKQNKTNISVHENNINAIYIDNQEVLLQFYNQIYSFLLKMHKIQYASVGNSNIATNDEKWKS